MKWFVVVLCPEEFRVWKLSHFRNLRKSEKSSVYYLTLVICSFYMSASCRNGNGSGEL